MGFFFQGLSPLTLITFAALVAVLVLLNDLSRRSTRVSQLFFLVFPVLLAGLVISGVLRTPSAGSWFGVVKTYSALAGVWGFFAIRYTKLGNTKFAWFFPAGILAFNILEAVIRDLEVFFSYPTGVFDAAGVFMQGGAWNVMNGIAGILSIVTLTGMVGIKVSQNKQKDMVWPDQLWFWIVAYDIWNVAYCYNCISTRSMYSGVALILACTIAEVFTRRGVWLQHRAQTLALFGMFSLAVDYQSMSAFQIQSSYNPDALMVLSVASLAANLAVFVYMVYVAKKYKRNPYTQELFVHLKSYKQNLVANNLEA